MSHGGLAGPVRVLNQMVTDGVLVNYAIGGAVAALFFTEPVTTFDLDVFVDLPAPVTRDSLVSLSAPYSWLTERGYRVEREHVVVDGLPVQLLPAYNDLVEEAIREAAGLPCESETARVVGPEHLIAISLQTGRSKDRERVRRLLEQAEPDTNRLNAILARHGLLERMKSLERDPGAG
jgi:hypothetical protein